MMQGLGPVPLTCRAQIHSRSSREPMYAWVEKGAVNLVHQLLILDAEDAVLRNNEKQARELYHKAIVSAARGVFLQHVGLAHERFAQYQLRLGNSSDVRYHLQESVKYFTDWGACRKVDSMRSKYGDFLVSRASDCEPLIPFILIRSNASSQLRNHLCLPKRRLVVQWQNQDDVET